MFTYAIGDIHGEYDLLQELLTKIKDHGEGLLVFLGDYIDRGPKSAQVVGLVRNLVQSGKAVALKGNHEDMMVSAFDAWWEWDPTGNPYFLYNGGDKTVESYQDRFGLNKTYFAMGVDAQWMEKLPLYYQDNHRIYVHGFAPTYEEDPKEFDPKSVLWDRYDSSEDQGWFGKHVVHGHTPKRSVELKVNRTNLDTGAVFYGTLTCGVFQDDLPGGPIEIIQAFRS